MLLTTFHIFWYDTDNRELFQTSDERELEMLIKKHKPKLVKSYFTFRDAMDKDQKLWRGMNG